MSIIKKERDHVAKTTNTISSTKNIFYLNVKKFTEKSHVSQIIQTKLGQLNRTISSPYFFSGSDYSNVM